MIFDYFFVSFKVVRYFLKKGFSMTEEVKDFLGGISEENREEERLYCNKFWAEYLDEIARKLIANDRKLKAFYRKNPMPWVISEEPDMLGAFFVRKNGNSRAFFHISRGMLNVLDNEDQLAFIMGHELEHYYQEMKANADKRERLAGGQKWLPI